MYNIVKREKLDKKSSFVLFTMLAEPVGLRPKIHQNYEVILIVSQSEETDSA